MEKYVSWTQILGASFMALVFILFIVLPVMWKFGCWLFIAKTKVITGKILDLTVGKFISDGRIIDIYFYLVIEDDKGHEKNINIPKEVFVQLNKRRNFFLKKSKRISLYFKDDFFKNEIFDHFEIA